MLTHVNFIQSLVNAVKAKGWADAYVSIGLTGDGLDIRPNYAYIYPMLKTADGEEIKPDEDTIYISGEIDFSEPDFYMRKIARVPTLKEYQFGKLFDAIKAAEGLAQDLNLPSDFINPLVAMATQLRTNIIEDQSDRPIPF